MATCLHSEDMDYFRSALDKTPESIERAGMLPSAEQVRALPLKELLPDLGLDKIICRCVKALVLTPVIFICSFRRV